MTKQIKDMPNDEYLAVAATLLQDFTFEKLAEEYAKAMWLYCPQKKYWWAFLQVWEERDMRRREQEMVDEMERDLDERLAEKNDDDAQCV